MGDKLGHPGRLRDLEVRRHVQPGHARSGRSSRCPGRSPARPPAAASTSSRPRRSASGGSPSRSSPRTSPWCGSRWPIARGHADRRARTPSATRPWATRSRSPSRSGSRSGSGASPCSSAASPSRSRRSSAGPARPASSALAMMLLWIASGLEIGGPLERHQPVPLDRQPRPARRHLRLGAACSPSASCGVVLLVVGVELFNRRDLGVTAGLSLPVAARRTSSASGARSAGRSATSCRGRSSWGIGLAIWGALLASLVGSVRRPDRQGPGDGRSFEQDLPGLRLHDRGQLAPAVRRAVPDRGRVRGGDVRLEVGLGRDRTGAWRWSSSTPLARARWVVAGGIAALLAVVVMTVLFAAGHRARRGRSAGSDRRRHRWARRRSVWLRGRDRRGRRRDRRPVADVAGRRDHGAGRGRHVPDRPPVARRWACRTGSTSWR